MGRLRRAGIGALIGIAVTYMAAVVGMYVFQRDLQYVRDGAVLALSDTALSAAEAVAIPTSDGAVINGWYQKPASGQPLIVYFRGNAQSFGREHARFEAFVAAGYGFLAFDYRGFPASPGEVTEAHVLADGLAAFDWAAQQGFPIVLWGRSLGTAPATWVAAQREAQALLLESPFLSAVQVAAERYPVLPVRLLMHDQYRLSEWMPDVTEPVFVAHGTADSTIPVEHGEAVHRLAPNKDELLIVAGGGHSDLWDRGLWAAAQVFFSRADSGR
ncbi:alpha/beta hydrolase [Devosia sp.]|uniref:alpha/beta hydrolase n=1 Tax=Devosia sp. TaxID=1871048 RepID=UPI003A94248F